MTDLWDILHFDRLDLVDLQSGIFGGSFQFADVTVQSNYGGKVRLESCIYDFIL